MPAAPRRRCAVIRIVVFALSLSAACSVQAFLTRVAIGPAESFAPAAGHDECLYRGALLNRDLNTGRALAVDLNRDAGQPVITALTARGRFAAACTRFCRETHRFACYRGGLMLAAISVPLTLSLTATLVMGAWRGQCLVPWLAVSLWWLKPNVRLLDAGWIEFTLVGPLAGLYLAGLSYFHRQPGTVGWLVIAGASAGGWALCPIPWAAFFLPATVVWLLLAHRHSWLWHGWLALAVLVGAATDGAQWFELVRHRQHALALLPDCAADSLPAGFDRATAWGAVGVQLALAVGPWVVAGCGPLLRLAPVAALTLALIVSGTKKESHQLELIGRVWAAGRFCAAWTPAVRLWRDEAAQHLRSDARLLCEVTVMGGEPTPFGLAGRCPLMVGRADESAAAARSLAEGRLAGRPVGDWSDAELSDWFDRWNIGWVWARLPATCDRLRKFARAKPLTAGAPGELFAIDRPRRYLLKGQGRVSFTGDDEIILNDVLPEDGEVVLSVRYQPGWLVNPSRIAVEPETDPYDAQPMIRLKLSGPTSRVVLRRDDR